MNTANGFIVLHRKLLEWEWHDNPNTLSLFIHLLLGANHEDNIKNGIEIKRGECLTSLPKLARLTGQTEKQVRVSLEHLKTAGTVADRSTNRYRIITVLKYDDYQVKGRQKGRQRADKRADKGQAEGHQYNNNNNENNITIIKEKEKEKTQPKPFTPPTLQEVLDYVSERGNKIDGEYFFYYYEDKGWDMKNWKAKIITWEKREEKYKNGSGNGRGSGSPEGNHGQNKPDYSKFSAGIIQL